MSQYLGGVHTIFYKLPSNIALAYKSKLMNICQKGFAVMHQSIPAVPIPPPPPPPPGLTPGH